MITKRPTDKALGDAATYAKAAGGGTKDDWSPQAREAAAKARAGHGGGGGGLPHSAREKGRDLTHAEMQENMQHAKKAYENHPYYQGKEKSDTSNANATGRHPFAKH